MFIALLVERIEIKHDYEVEIKLRISVEQYMWIAAYGQTERLPQGDEPCGSLCQLLYIFLNANCFIRMLATLAILGHQG